MNKNKYTVIITTFEQCSFFILHVLAENVEEAKTKALDYGHGETGLLYDQVLDVFEDFCESVSCMNNPIQVI